MQKQESHCASSTGEINLSPVYLHYGLSVLTANVPAEWNSNFQNKTDQSEIRLEI